MRKTRKPKYYVAQTGGNINSGFLNNISDPVTAQFLQQTNPAQNPWTITDNGTDAPRSQMIDRAIIPQQPINTSANLPSLKPSTSPNNPGTYNVGVRPRSNKAGAFINGFNGVAEGVTAIANQLTNNKLNRTEQQQLLQTNQRFQQAPQGPLNTNPAYTQYGGKYQVGGQVMDDGTDMTDPDYDDYSGDMVEQLKAGGWIKGAVNPAHKGYCTPMTKSTCTPRRKAFAMTMKKHHGFHHAQAGGQFSPEEQSLVDTYTARGYNVTKDPASGQLKYVKNGVTANPATAASNASSQAASQAATGNPNASVSSTTPQQQSAYPDRATLKKKYSSNKYLNDDQGRYNWGNKLDSDFLSGPGGNVRQAIYSAARQNNIDPSLLYSSAMEEGMSGRVNEHNKDDVSAAYDEWYNANKDTAKKFPIDSFRNYGLDQFAGNEASLEKKGYLPKGFNSNYKTFDATNEKNEPLKASAFNSDANAVLAKSAMMRNSQDQLNDYAKKNNINLSDAQKNFFLLANYNGGEGNMQKMIQSYKDKGYLKDDKFLDPSFKPASYSGIYNNVQARLQSANQMNQEGFFKDYNQQQQNTAATPQQSTSQQGSMKAGGTVTRKEDYGSSSHPYPSVPSNEFAGGHRSYPIPTKENARKALYLAHIHHRPDVIAKVHAKYPGLKQTGGFGGGQREDLQTNNFMAKSGGWIKGAINPAHKGYCTPMTKSTCTPRRKALARRFKSGDLSHHQAGGDLYNDVPQYEIDNNLIMQAGGDRYTPVPPTYNMFNTNNPNSSVMTKADSADYLKHYNLMKTNPKEALYDYNYLESINRKYLDPYYVGSGHKLEPLDKFDPSRENAINAYEDALQPGTMILNRPPDTKKPSKHQAGGVPQVQGLDQSQANSANVEAEKGEVFTTQNGNMGQVDPNGATHEQGGEMLPQVSRVLENTSNLRKDKVSKYLRLNPEQIKALTGLDTNQSMSHAEALIKGQENLEKQKNNIISKIQLAAKGNNGTGLDMYGENSTKLNIDHFRAMPTKAELFNRLFDHQEMTKNALGISNDGGMETARYGGKYIMQAGGVTAYPGNTSGQTTPAGNSDAFQGDLNTYLGKLKANGFKFDNIHSNADLQRALYANELKNNPNAIKNMWQEGIQNYGLDKAAKAGFIYTEDDPTKGVKKGQFKPGVLDKPENLQKLADLYPDNLLGRRILDLSANKGPKVWNDSDLPPIPNNPQAGVTNPDPSIKNTLRFRNNPKSEFNEPLNWYDTASPTNAYLSSLRRLPENFNRVDVHQLNLKLLDPTASLRANQGDFNAAVQATQQADPNNTGAQMANIANLTARKYALNNQVMGNYDQQNAGIKNQEITYNTQAKDKQSIVDAQAREDFSNKVLTSKAKQQEQKLTALDGLYKTIAENSALNRNGNLIMKMSRAFDQYGNYNGYAPSFQPNPQLGISSNPSTNANPPVGKAQPAGGIQGLTAGKNYYNRRTGKTLRFDGNNLVEVK